MAALEAEDAGFFGADAVGLLFCLALLAFGLLAQHGGLVALELGLHIGKSGLLPELVVLEPADLCGEFRLAALRFGVEHGELGVVLLGLGGAFGGHAVPHGVLVRGHLVVFGDGALGRGLLLRGINGDSGGNNRGGDGYGDGYLRHIRCPWLARTFAQARTRRE